MTILIIGGTGAVGRAACQTLVGRGTPVRVLSRSARYAQDLGDGIEGWVGDLDHPDSLRPALEGVDGVFLIVPNSPAEMHQALTALSVIREAGRPRLVYLSSAISVAAPFVPHAGAKIGVEAGIRASGLAFTILRPTFFAQNDLMVRDALLAGLYPLPIGTTPIARVDVRDVADAAVTSLLTGKAEGRTVLISSADQPTGPEAAALWAEALGRKVTFPDMTVEALAEAVVGALPPDLVFDLKLMFRFLRTEGGPVDPATLKDQAELLPNGLRRYADFITGCAREWTAGRAR